MTTGSWHAKATQNESETIPSKKNRCRPAFNNPSETYGNSVGQELSAELGISASGCTPIKPTLQRNNTVSSCGITSAQIPQSHKHEAMRDVESYLEKEVPSIVEMAAPYEETYQIEADRIADAIVKDLEKRLEGADTVDFNSTSPVASSGTQFESSAYSSDSDFSRIQLLCANKPGTNKANLCWYFQSLICFVVCRIQQLASTDLDVIGSDMKPWRLVIPTVQMEFKCRDEMESERIDIGIIAVPINITIDDFYSTTASDTRTQSNTAKSNPGYVDMLLVVEAKQIMSSVNLELVRVQLFRYTRNIYQMQHNRQLLWGMVICGTLVQVYTFIPSHASASPSMDITTQDGRSLFIQLLVNWSYCEDYHLGYDPTIKYLDDIHCWEIQVTIEDSNNNGSIRNHSMTGSEPHVQTFYSDTILVNANCLFGRHTQCFTAVAERPTIKCPISSMVSTVNIKDSWPEAEMDVSKDLRDEIQQLRKIRSCLSSNSELRNIYPVIEAGGRVHIQHSSQGDWALDYVQCRISANIDNLMQPSSVCVHKRVATSPVRRPLNKLNSVYKLIIVMADAMQCHGTIVDKCKILHCDISMNNVLFMKEGEDVKGLLIDFDCAFNLDNPGNIPCTECTGLCHL
ncbi:hypothetical protein COEREDRAFT_12157 [Coemansia reversa NRRL 1564]|uniref:Fungal-type protein kinase domain-containing protein n=1 Tax=Coemansia reversa (strain ATCC 12441 / NRRL 1564) TaxID=763665 RepID=A0A2G5B1B3_COERN|nr:hypothetical protein COEREDRAFT_12157 [Coemansia reversa NRRL 1564]|eukprot:PIA12803.1 hypothetical protein COEREDRAFT_12157 [Coemansia reversa NRRL 1564]